MIIYDGPSQIDGSPIVAILTGLKTSSKNSKTGDMLQLWILGRDLHPHTAASIGEDVGVCGSCPHRPMSYRAAGVARCYVETAKAPAAVWRSYQAGKYPAYSLAARVDKPIRLGAYGDPGALPASAIIAAIRLSNGKTTGYTHAWRARPDLIACCMASVDSPEEQAEASAAGWRTFHVGSSDPMAILCPASAEAGKRTSCASCLLCSGARGTTHRANIYIPAH